MDGWLPFEFKRARELPGWGTVLDIPAEGVTPEMDGAPIVNALGRLVGITRVRWVEGEQSAFGLPVRWLFDLFRGTLSSKLTDLRRLEQWDDWKSMNSDDTNGMTHIEFECRQRIADLESELLLGRQRERADNSEESLPPISGRGVRYSESLHYPY